MLILESGTLDIIFLAFSILSSMRITHLTFLRGSAPNFLAKSPPIICKIYQSNSRAPRFLSDLWQIIFVFPCTKEARVTVVLECPKSTKATTFASLASNSFFLKNPYCRAIAVLSLITRKQFKPATSHASNND